MELENKYINMGELELEIMDILWEKKTATVKDIHETLLAKRDIAYTTVMTVMTRLSEKNILKRSQLGRLYVYKPKISRNEIAQNFINRIKEKFFRGSYEEILSFMITEGSFTHSDLSKIKKIIEESEQNIAK